MGLGGTTSARQFNIFQVISNELSLSPPGNVIMSGSLGGITGGTAVGQTQFIVTSSNSTGYSAVLTASSSLGMIGTASTSNYIPAYVPTVPAVPDFAFNTPVNAARFGYSVESSSTVDLVPAFLDNGVNTCGTGSNDTVNACWLNASTTAFTVLNRSSPTLSTGSTSTIKFRVTISSNPNPLIPNDTYVATTTLTFTAN